MIGKKVRITKRCAKWFLDNPYVFIRPRGQPDESFDIEMQIHLYVCLGGFIDGRISKLGSKSGRIQFYGAEFNTIFGYSFHYFQLGRDLELI